MLQEILFKMMMVLSSCVFALFRARFSRLPNPTLTLTFKRHVPAAGRIALSTPLATVRMCGWTLSSMQNGRSCVLSISGVQLSAFTAVTWIQPWHGARPLPLSFPRGFSAIKPRGMQFLSCQDLSIVPM